MTPRQEHERHLHALTHDKSKKNLKFLLVGLGVVLFAGGHRRRHRHQEHVDKSRAAPRQPPTSSGRQIDQAEAKRQSLAAELASAQAAGVDTDALKAEIAAQNSAIEALKNKAPDRPQAGRRWRRRRRCPGGEARGRRRCPKAACNCTPGDPLCSCL